MAGTKPTLYLFSVGPPGLRVLLGWRAGRLLGPFRTLDAALRGRPRAICGPCLDAEAQAAGVPTGPLPEDALQARALFAAFTLWHALLDGSPPPAAIRALLDACRALHERRAGDAGPWRMEVDGRRFAVQLRDAALTARCEHAPLELVLRLSHGPDFAARALADAGWPVVPLPLARAGGRRLPVDLEDLVALTRIVRRVVARLPARPRSGEAVGSYRPLAARIEARFAGMPELLAVARALVQALEAEEPGVAQAFEAAVDALLGPAGPLRALAVEEALALRLRIPPAGTLDVRVEERLGAALRSARSGDEALGAVAGLVELERHRLRPEEGDLVDQVDQLAGDVLDELEGTPAYGSEAVA